MAEALESYRTGTEAEVLSIVSEPWVFMTRRGYAPVVTVEVGDPAEQKMLYISSHSLSEALEPLVEANGGKFQGIRIKVKKESEEKFAKYVVEPVA